MNNKTDINVQYVSPLKKICMTIGELPASYLETMSYYEMLVWFTEFLKNQVIPAVNNNAEAVSELQALYEELRIYVNDYFDNLDVQEEINNKLDEMAESGQLTDIIAQYLGLAGMIAFDTVADMKSAQNLVNGSKCRTLGYHSVNDHGGAYYKIRTVTNDDVVDEMTIIEVYDNLLVAELILPNELNIKQLGAENNSEITNQYKTALQVANKIIIENINGTIETYPVITIPSNREINIINSTLTTKANATAGSSQAYRTGLFFINEASNITINGINATLVGDMSTHTGTTHQWNAGIRLVEANNIHINGIKLLNHTGDGICVGGVSKNVYINNCEITDNFRNGISLIDCENVITENCYFYECGKNIAPYCSIDIEPDPNDSITDNITIRNCEFKNSVYNILFHDPNWNDTAVSTSQIKNSYVYNNKFYNTGTFSNNARALIVQGLKSGVIKFNNNEIDNFRTPIQIQYTKNLIIENNNIKNISYFTIDNEDSEKITISDNLFKNFENICLYNKHVDNSIFENNVFEDIKHQCIYFTTNNDNTKHSSNNIINNNKFINYTFTGETNNVCIIGLYFYSTNNIISKNTWFFTSSYLEYAIRGNAGQSTGNIIEYNNAKSQNSGTFDLNANQKTLMNIVDGALVEGNMMS